MNLGSQSTAEAFRCGSLVRALLLSTVLPASILLPATEARAQSVQTSFNIPAGPLSRAIAAFGRQSGTQVSYDSSIAAGISSPGMRGAATRQQALAQILQGSGLSYSFTDATSVVITGGGAATNGGAASSDALPAADGSVVLETVVVDGEGQPASVASDTPLATQTTAEEISRREIRDIRELGNTTEPGLHYSTEQEGPIIRGQTGPRVVTKIDDIAIPHLENYARRFSLHNGDGGSTAFDFSSLSALDVVRGADSSRLGGGALGGAIVMRTLEPEDLIEAGRSWGAVTKLGYDSKNRSVFGAVATAARFGSTSMLLQGALTKGNETDNQGKVRGLGSARTMPNPADLDQNNLLFKIRHELEGGHKIGLTAERFDRQLDVDDLRSTLSNPSYVMSDYVTYDALQRSRLSFDYSYEAPDPDAFVQGASAKAYWQRTVKSAGESHDRNYIFDPSFSHSRVRDNELYQKDIGFVGGLNGGFDTGTLSHDWRFGIDALAIGAGGYVYVTPPTFAAVSQADMPDVDGYKLGMYLEDTINIGESGFALTPGLRFDWHQYTPKLTPEFAQNTGYVYFGLPPAHGGTRVSPKLMATYQVTPYAQVFAQWSAAYRVPTINELYLNFTNPALGYTVRGNGTLKSETGSGVEVGVNLGTDDFGARIVAFRTDYKNYITEGPMRPDPVVPWLTLFAFENLDNARISGLEFKAHKNFESGFKLHGGLAYGYGKDLNKNTRLRTVAPMKAVVGVGYERETWGVDVTGVFSAKMPDDQDKHTFDAPSYATANVGAWWEPASVKGLRIQAGINNLFDEKYFDALQWRRVDISADAPEADILSEPGRTFTLSATMRF